MANLGLKGNMHVIRFRFEGKEYKKSLKTKDSGAAKAAHNLVELTLHRLHTGQVMVPDGVDPGDFVVSGGTLTAPRPRNTAGTAPLNPTIVELAEKYEVAHEHLHAPSYLDSQKLHLRHLKKFLGRRADEPCDRISHRDLDAFLQHRLAIRQPLTAERERITLLLFFKWIVRQGFLSESPAVGLAPIKGGEDRPPFRTVEEIERTIARGGLTDEERLELWDCLYLSPPEIATLLATDRTNSAGGCGFMLHALPAYTGMRRGELLRLRWIDIDLDDGFVSARSRKQSRRKRETVRRITLHPELKAILSKWKCERPHGQFVICEADGDGPIDHDKANRVFWQPMRRTVWCLDNSRDLFKVGFHTYRHSFASNLAAAGVDQRVIDEFMGHTTEAMRKCYRHLFPRSSRSAIESISLLAG